jgi:hypothetical protein
MSAIAIPESVVHILDIIPGETNEDKLLQLLADNIINKIKECDSHIIEFETNYGMSFVEFKRAWKGGLLGSPLSYKLERDYIEWEGFYMEKKKWFSLLKEIRDSSKTKR